MCGYCRRGLSFAETGNTGGREKGAETFRWTHCIEGTRDKQVQMSAKQVKGGPHILSEALTGRCRLQSGSEER